MSDAIEAGSGKPRKRQASKTSRGHAASKVKATIHLTVEASQRLSVHAAMLGVDRSELVEQLIRDGLKRFVVSDRSRAGDEGTGEAA